MATPNKVTPESIKADIETTTKTLAVLKQMEIVDQDFDQLIEDLTAITKSPTLLGVFIKALKSHFQI
jgi:hypothetical protein